MGYHYADAKFEWLFGETLTAVRHEREGSEERVVFMTQSEQEYVMHHVQDCCETVWLEEVIGDFDDLVGSPITMAEVVEWDGSDDEDCDESRTWTFYKLATNKGYVTLRWCGQSSGRYSERVDFMKRTPYRVIPQL